MTEEAADNTAEIAQVAPDELFHQVGLGPIDRAGDLEIDGGVTGQIL